LDPTLKKSIVAKRAELSIDRQCELLGLPRASYYYEAPQPTAEEIALKEAVMNEIDYWHSRQPAMGVRRLRAKLREKGLRTGRKLIKRYMEEMGIYAVYPKPSLSKRNKQHRIYPYLLRNMYIFIPNQVWAIDITYIKMQHRHMYLTVIIDWYSRFIVGWALSDTLDTAPVLEALKRAIETHGIPAIINSDQGSQFTSEEYTDYLRENGIRQSMDGKARWVDNVIIERWFRSLKHENIYINEYNTPRQLKDGIREYVREYNTERPHQSLDYRSPAAVYGGCFVA
jgi:putative transposase